MPRGPQLKVTDAAEILTLHSVGMKPTEIVELTGWGRSVVFAVCGNSHPILDGQFRLYYPVKCGVFIDRVTQAGVNRAGLKNVTITNGRSDGTLIRWTYFNPAHKNVNTHVGTRVPRIWHSTYMITKDGIFMWEHEAIDPIDDGGDLLEGSPNFEDPDTTNIPWAYRDWHVVRYLKMAEDGIYRMLDNKLGAIDPSRPKEISLRNLIYHKKW